MVSYPFQQPPQQMNFFKSTIQQIRPVSSIEEVKASPIEFDGSIFYFPDVANKKIYTKFVNMDGTVSINMYELKPIVDQTMSSSYVTRKEFEDVILQIKNMLTSKEQEVPQQQQQQSSNFNF